MSERCDCSDPASLSVSPFFSKLKAIQPIREWVHMARKRFLDFFVQNGIIGMDIQQNDCSFRKMGRHHFT
jgi:hypothetical protein